MLLSISTTHRPATDLGYLLSKHPDRLQTVDLAFGQAHVFYPQADSERCTAALLLDIDPVGLVRGRGDGSEGPLAQYVNDRPYVASSFLAVALARVFRSALAGTSRGREELAQTPIPLDAEIAVLRSRGGEASIRDAFEPLGYRVELEPLPLDARFPEWGASPYWRVKLSGCLRLQELLTHLYVLLPAIDGDKHYFVGDDEVEKLLAKAGTWLAAHPQREWITSRYLKRRRSLVRSALARLLDAEEDDIDSTEQAREAAEERIERPMSLNEQRLGAVLAVLRQSGARRVVDLGCGEGRLLAHLSQGTAVRPDPRRRRVAASARYCGRTPASGAAAAVAARAHHARAGRADLPRRTPRRVRRGLRDRGDRAPRSAAAAGVRAQRVRVRTTGTRRRDHAERGIQRTVRILAERPNAPL
ncbi:MAG TPA: 3' terminal RNA ribose 2'-O-methyltransferase Hen1 [Tahibacter sp.]|uniref:3' terminal RNA ribose 2'-O-methyltransferase Hen1 n=1 Tax=Tahibacter sp. TaxID=2056211 RepID=UPI002B9FE1C2|nr:3' terminal RNA ribose 2'-O-methyltransferase Hen1 [Tahibacter sp.]HSX60750.1 3' terminal RNA ribose 2'-O-methyltransferase Hen1 [Tahibacter sp.]